MYIKEWVLQLGSEPLLLFVVEYSDHKIKWVGWKKQSLNEDLRKWEESKKISMNLNCIILFKKSNLSCTLKIQIIAKLPFCLLAMKNENWKETKLYYHTSNIICIIYIWFLLQFWCHQCHKLDSSKIAIVEKNIWNVATCWV